MVYSLLLYEFKSPHCSSIICKDRYTGHSELFTLIQIRKKKRNVCLVAVEIVKHGSPLQHLPVFSVDRMIAANSPWF